MFIVRLLGRIFQLIALGTVGLGLWLWIAGHDVTLPAGQLWFQFDVGTLNFFQVIVQRYIYAPIWDAAIVPMLQRSTWEALLILFVITLVLGFALGSLARERGRRRRRR
jgi:hypothetical protein